jgi:glycosyltransferase involved in cell wall biosynthesis
LKTVAVLIPAYCPDQALVRLVEALSHLGCGLICIVDDGSPEPYQKIFSAAMEHDKVLVLRHAHNKGKGAALKTGFAQILKCSPDIRYVVTADADGQHQAEDIHRVALASLEDDDAMVLGVREFQSDVPARSRFGNLLTRWIFGIFSGTPVRDTQTGLRGIPVHLSSEILGIEANRYEYELEAILTAIRSGVRIKEVPIKTIYLEGNASSHFRPIIDSLRIYFVFLRYSAISVLSFFLDVLLFSVLLFLTGGRIMMSTYGARVLSGSFNFFANRTVVFQSNRRKTLAKQAGGYIALAFVIATLSGLGVSGVVKNSDIHPVTAKVLVDVVLFILSFLTQRYLIFRNSRAY